MIKKIFIILILVAILINSSMVIKNNTYALTYISDAIDMKVDKEEIKVGEEITLTVYITGTMSSNLKNIKNINLSLIYDNDFFECTDIVSPKNNYNYGTITINDENGTIIYKYNASAMRVLSNGTILLNVKLKAKKDGMPKIKLSYSATDSDTTIRYGDDNLELSLKVTKDLVNIIKNLPKYYVFDMDKIIDAEIAEYTSQKLAKYIEQVIGDDSIKIDIDDLQGGGDFTFREWCADVKVFRNGELSDTVHLGWEDNSQITTFGLISITPNIKKSEEAYIVFAQNQIENKYNWKSPYKIEKYEELENEEIVLLDTEKFGTMKYKGEELQDNIFSFTPDGETQPEPLLLMQENGVLGDINEDGKVTLLDYGLVLAHVKRTKLLTGDMLERADVNGDGKVTLLDYGLILAHVKRTKLLF